MWTYSGSWCDVVPSPLGGAIFARIDGQTVIVLHDDAELWRIALPEAILYLRVAVLPDLTVWVIGQGHATGHALLIGDGTVISLGPSFGQSCTCLCVEDGELAAYVQTSPTTYTRTTIHPWTQQTIPIPLPGGTSQGWIDAPDRWTDLYRTTSVNGYVFTLPAIRGRCTVGQSSGVPGVLAAIDTQTGQPILGDAFEPHVAALADGSYAVCARQLHNVCALAEVPPLPPVPTTPLTPWAHPAAVAPFFPTADAPGHWVILNNGHKWADVAGGRPCFADLASAGSVPPDKLLGFYCGDDDLDAVIRVAGPSRRVLVVHDAPDAFLTASIRKMRPFDLAGLECYVIRGEMARTSQTRWLANLDGLLGIWAGQVAIVFDDYTQSDDLPLAQVEAVQPYISDLVNRSVRVVLVAPFAWDRPSGCITYPSLAAAVRAQVAASPGVPTLTPIPIPPQPDSDPRLLFLWSARMSVPVFISSKQLNKQDDGSFTITIANPLTHSYVGLPSAGTTLPGATGADCVLSIPGDSANPEARAKGTNGINERFFRSGNLLTSQPDPGVAPTLPVVDQK